MSCCIRDGLAYPGSGNYIVITMEGQAVKAELIRIGNSQGIRIPKPIIEQCGFEGRVEMTVADGKLVVAPARAVRAGWDEAFKAAAADDDDAALFPDNKIGRTSCRERVCQYGKI